MPLFFALNNPLIFSVTGKDAQRYLNARLTNNIKDLKIGDSCVAGMLSPQGRTEGLFTVQKISETEFILICSGGDIITVVTALKKYIVADRVTVVDRSNTDKVLHLISPDKIESSLIRIKSRRSQIIGEDLLGSSADIFNLIEELKKSGFQEISTERHLIMRLRAKILSFPEELNDKVNFAEGIMDHAISFTKGCYVGQEVIEKVNAFGKVPRLFFFGEISGKYNFADPYELSLPGKVITSVYDSELSQTLCVLSLPSEMNESSIEITALQMTTNIMLL